MGVLGGCFEERGMTQRDISTTQQAGMFSLRSLSPFELLEEETLQRIERCAVTRSLPSGFILFNQGSKNDEALYLLAGTVELRLNGLVMGTVRAGTPEARYPLGNGSTHNHYTRVVSSSAEVLAIDREMLDMLVTWDQTGSYKVLDLQEDVLLLPDPDDWMVQVLRSKAFARMPPENIQTMFMRLQRIEHAAGDVVIRQGAEGDYFYVIVRGRCTVARTMPTGAGTLTLAELGVGECFGEEALISDARRNASVTMLTSGTLMRLPKEDFRKLCSEPIQREVNYSEACKIVAAGGSWLDVRLPSEVANYGILVALNIPLYMLRMKIKVLPLKTPLVVLCDTGRRSAAAAYILAHHGYKTFVLKGGLTSLDSDALSYPAPRAVAKYGSQNS
jgi:CRP-like cAMP-binding protein